MVTIKDVAAAAGVSATTVSNVIHGYTTRVSKETAEKIQSVIQEMGYTPNMSARSLVSHSSHMIALIYHSQIRETTDLVLDPFHLTMISQIEASIRQSSYYLMLRSCRTTQELTTFLQNWNVDGLFILGKLEDDFLETLERSGKPCILLENHPADSSVSSIGQDDYRGGFLSASYLLSRGHTKIGYASTAREYSSIAVDRFHGFRDALSQAGYPIDESLVFKCDTDSFEASTALAENVYKALPSGMTAIGVSCDQLAYLIINRLTRRGITLPEQLSIIGFGGLPQSRLTIPELTTIFYDIEKKGALSVSLMLGFLSGEKTEQANIVLPVSLVERESVYTIEK